MMDETTEHFDYFLQLNDELILHTLSFVSDAPYESSDVVPFCTLHDSLPLICKRVNKLVKSQKADALWKEALVRLCHREAYVWRRGLEKFLRKEQHRRGSHGCSSVENLTDIELVEEVVSYFVNNNKKRNNEESISNEDVVTKKPRSNEEGNSSAVMVEHACNTKTVTATGYSSTIKRSYSPSQLNESLWNHREVSSSSINDRATATITTAASKTTTATTSSSCKLSDDGYFTNLVRTISPSEYLYRYMLDNHLKFTKPVLMMPGEAFIGVDIEWRLFEPRYRTLIAEIMAGHGSSSYEEEEGDNNNNFSKAIEEEERTFIYAYSRSIEKTSPATLVRVKKCHIFDDGRANVTVVPIAHVLILSSRERPNSGGLFDCRVIRMSSMSCKTIEKSLQRHRRYWINNLTGEGEENHWVEGGTIGGRQVRGSINAIMAFMDRA